MNTSQKVGTRGRNKVLAGFAGLALALGLAIVPAHSASAVCNLQPSKGATWTQISHISGCVYTKYQARIDRYVGTAPVSYYGAQGANYSYVANSSGINAGHAYRYGTSTWSQWIYF